MKNITEEKTLSENIENITGKFKIPKEYDNKILKKVFINLVIAICIMLYLVGINIAYSKIDQSVITNVIKVSTLIFLAIGIILLEIAYKKESATLLISSIEALVFSTHSLTIMHIIKIFNFDFQLYILTSSYVFSIYYVLKTIVIHTKGRRDYLKSLSDISEIVKKDEPVKKESKKRKIQENEKIETEQKDKAELENKPKKRGRPKKTETKVEDKNQVENKPKKRGRPKKTETKIEDKNQVEDKPKKRGRPKKVEPKAENVNQEENKPKKRGRPKKEVTIND